MIDSFTGDVISGRISRLELADTVVQVLGSSHSSGKTFECRRRDEPKDQIIANTLIYDLTQPLKRLIADNDRVVRGDH